MQMFGALHIFPCFLDVFSEVHDFWDGKHGPFQNRWSLLLRYTLKLKFTLKNTNFLKHVIAFSHVNVFCNGGLFFPLNPPALKTFHIPKPKKMV